MTGTELDEFVSELISGIRSKRRSIFKSNCAKQTGAMRTILQSMAKKRHYQFHPNRIPNRKEFLCDFVWLRSEKQHPVWVNQMALAVECEWHSKRSDRSRLILEDFRKLLVVNAKWKLCIYQVRKGSPEGTGEKLRAKICAGLERFEEHHRNTHYLLLEIDRMNERPSIFHWRATFNGKVSHTPTFRPEHPCGKYGAED